MPMDNSIADQMRSAIGNYLLPHRHTALLVAIVALLGVRPLISGTGAGNAVFSCHGHACARGRGIHHPGRRITRRSGTSPPAAKEEWRSSDGRSRIVAVIFRLGDIVSPSHQLATGSSISLLLFLVFVALTELRAVLKQRTVTRETISMSISVYLLFGMTWGLFYIVLFDLQPHAFSFGGAPIPSEQQVTPVLVYFSLTTIATVGYGDITPLTLQARYASVAEGIAGQFYLAILVARLVGMQMSQSASRVAEDPSRDTEARKTAEREN